MMVKNEIFKTALDWLIENKYVDSQKSMALKTGINQNTISRIITGKVEPKDDTLRKLNGAFFGVFNMKWLRGESSIMLAEDAAKSRQTFRQAMLGTDDDIQKLKTQVENLTRENEILRQYVEDLRSIIPMLHHDNFPLRDYSQIQGIVSDNENSNV